MLLDCDSFDPLGAWEVDRGPQKYSYDFWWHLGHDTLLSSEWGTPAMFEVGCCPGAAAGPRVRPPHARLGSQKRRHLQALDLGDAHQMVLELRPAHDPRKAYGFVGVVVSVEDLSASVWLWHRDGAEWAIKKVITIPAEPAEADQLPRAAQGLRRRAAAGDRYQPVARRPLPVRLVLGHRRLHPVRRVRPIQPGRDRARALGGIASKAAHPASGPLTGGPQMVEAQRDGKRIYVTNGLYTSWDKQFYPGGRRRLGGQAGRARRRRSRGRHQLRDRGPGRAHPASDPTRGRRLLLGLVLLLVSTGDLAGIAGLGAFHGINPAMGWLFAVALALQDRSRGRRSCARCRRSPSAMPSRSG